MENRESMYQLALDTIGTASKLPMVHVKREEFLRNQFKGDKHLESIIKEGPQAVYDLKYLRKKANKIIDDMTAQTSITSFVMGLPSNPFTAIAAGGADIAQYFGFAINMAQQIAYLFGEDELFSGNAKTEMSEEAKMRILVYLGIMLGAAGANNLIGKFSEKAGVNIGKKVASKALTKTTTWYPLLKKIGAVLGVKITKKTVEKGITKFIPIVGGVLSGGLTYFTFKPMGENLTQTFIDHLEGKIDEEAIYNPEFLAKLEADNDNIIDAEFTEKA